MTLDTILEEIKKAKKIVILTHEGPDGDAMGSSIAFSLALKLLGKDSDVIIPEYSKTFDFLPEVTNIKTKTDIEKYDLAVSLDCADSKILKGYKKYFEKAKMKIVIDHHSSNTMYGDINFINPAAPSCSEILIGMFEYYGIDITKDIATCIMTGIITDTGGFCFNSTYETFEFAAEILGKGVNMSEIVRKTLNTKSKANFELNKIASSRMEFLENDKVAFTYITAQDEIDVGARQGDHEGIVDIGKNIENIEVSVFLHEVKGKGIKLSLRSVEYVNVADIAIMFGGGRTYKSCRSICKRNTRTNQRKSFKRNKKTIKIKIKTN